MPGSISCMRGAGEAVCHRASGPSGLLSSCSGLERALVSQEDWDICPPLDDDGRYCVIEPGRQVVQHQLPLTTLLDRYEKHCGNHAWDVVALDGPNSG